MAFYHQISSFPDENFCYTQNPYENDYNNYSYCYYPPPQSSANFYSYEFAPTPSLIAYSHPGSIQYTVHHSVAGAPPLLEDEDINFAEHDPHPYAGGYDIAQTYGKPLPPSDDICYPPSSISPNLPPPTLVPVAKVVNQEEELPIKEEAENVEVEAQLTEEEEEVEDEEEEDEDEDEDDEDDDEEEEEEEDRSMIVYEGVEENNSGRELNQIPYGYGLEAFDLCENLFGYWPCVSKMKKKCGACGNEINGVVGGGDDVDEWKKTADYLFGNPDPYGGWTGQGGYPSAYPVYGYDQMQYQYHPQPGYVVCEQADQYGQNSWFP